MNILVIGGGLAGVQSAYFLLRDGHQVTLIERNDDIAHGTSFANGGLITPSHAAPWNSPDIFRTLLASIGKKDAAIRMKIGALGHYLGWGQKFIRNSTKARYNRTFKRHFNLAHYSQKCLHQMMQDVPLDFTHAQNGSLMVYSKQTSFDAARERFNQLKQFGITVQICDGNELAQIEPALTTTKDQLAGGVYFPDDEHGNAREFTQSLARYLGDNGVEIQLGTNVTDLIHTGSKVLGVQTDKGDMLADAVVVATGPWSARLLKGIGVALPVRPVKGSSITYDLPQWNGAPKMPVVDDDLHVAVTPLGDSIRIVGTAEFCGFDASVQPDRMDMLRRAGAAILPKLGEAISGVSPTLEWSGLRPMTPDCMPILGKCGFDNLYLNTGHGYLGWTTSTGSSQTIADLVAERAPSLNVADYALTRF